MRADEAPALRLFLRVTEPQFEDSLKRIENVLTKKGFGKIIMPLDQLQWNITQALWELDRAIVRNQFGPGVSTSFESDLTDIWGNL